MNQIEWIGQLFIFTITFWLGLYCIAYDWRRLLFWLAAVAALTFSISIAGAILDPYAPNYEVSLQLLRWQRLLLIFPALCWLVIFWLFVPGYKSWSRRFQQQRLMLLLLIAGMLIYALLLTWWIFPGRRGREVIITLLIGADLFFLGLVLIMSDAQERGEAWLGHFLRALDYSFFTAVLFGGQVALAMWLSTGVNFAMLLLLLGVISVAICVQTFSDQAQAFLDRIAFFYAPAIQEARRELRVESNAVQRRDMTIDLGQMTVAEFTRHTRRALSDMGDLPRLASSPLTHLPIIDQQLGQKSAEPHLARERTLVRATALKQILTDNILQLKPRDKGEFGTTAEWRFYNALYFPYVLGVRPYRRFPSDDMGFADHVALARQAADWFRSQVPKRTLYNWQNKAADLIAQDLRERMRQGAP